MIVLLTDFGPGEYVGVMKAVIYSIDNSARTVDLCHDISPQCIVEGSWILKCNYKYFPEGSTFCCVVDPGVGTERKAIAVKTERFYFVGPDNGLLWEALQDQKIVTIRQMNVPPGASRTFHGRDVFAKAAAKISIGGFDELGEELPEMEKLELYQNGREGTVVRIDGFGNVITNLPRENKEEYTVRIGRNRYRMGYYPEYHSANEDDLFLIEGSNNTLEISLRNGSANDRLRLRAGARISIV
ncbi:MAG: SAM-dependent chlorinase/fluorinase [Phycisphaerales bacterium]|nr:MAG: SAM-dependent chlorinase/fluorinase [Phycisphaerales bacterium]